MIQHFFKKFQPYFEYLPLMLIPLILISEDQVNHQAVSVSCKMSIIILTTMLFFLLIMKFRVPRHIAFMSVIILWIVFVHLKKTYIDIL